MLHPASNEASFVTGSELVIDGGTSAIFAALLFGLARAQAATRASQE